jgi:hypothetical protein
MVEYGTFTLNGYVFTRFLPSSANERCEWLITVTRDGTEVRRETVSIVYAPIFGPDVEDVARCDARVEEIIKDMGLE